jgi:hypothetical protein
MAQDKMDMSTFWGRVIAFIHGSRVSFGPEKQQTTLTYFISFQPKTP